MLTRKLIFLLLLNSIQFNNAKTIYFSPGQFGQLFNIDDAYLNANGHQTPMYRVKLALEQNGFIVKQANSLKNLTDVHCIITFDIPINQLADLHAYSHEKCFAFLWEPPSVTPSNYEPSYHHFFSHIYTWHDGLLANSKFRKFYYPVMNPMVAQVVPFEQRKLCTQIACNKRSNHPNELYTARRHAIEYFEENHCEDFDLYGYGWPAYKNYRGSIGSKIDVLPKYKFCICYENIKNVPGYITEKIFDCFRCGCIPIYWGADNITDYIPANCFIDRNQFKNYEQMYTYLKNMDKETFENYLSNIRNYLNSSAAQAYSVDMFVSIMLDLALSVKGD